MARTFTEAGARTVVVLESGDRIDISDLTPAAAVALLRERGITAADIRETVHILREPVSIAGGKP